MTTAAEATIEGTDLRSGGAPYEVLIVGAGFGGIGVAIELKRIGIEDFVLVEKATDVGGTWRDNTYPGLEVDIPSFSYSYAHAMKPDWSQVYAPGAEVQSYAQDVVRRHDLRRHVSFATTVTGITWDDATAEWIVTTEDGRTARARHVVAASGYLVGPKLPDIAGIDDYAGTLMHTARWDHDYDLRDKRVAVIGTGATAVQVVPTIADGLASLDVYQRTAIWLAPKPNRVFSERTKRLMRRWPVIGRAARTGNWVASELYFSLGFLRYDRFPQIGSWVERALIKQIRKQVDDPQTQDKLIPTYSFFCKRPSFSSTFYPLFNRENVSLITEPISHFTETGIVTKDGVERDVDAVICATGYKVFDRDTTPTFAVRGVDGVDLGAWWDENRYQAFLGTTVPGFPNFYVIVGPYAAAGASYFDVLANQVVHISRLLRHARARAANRVEVKRRALDRDFARVQRRGRHTVLGAGSCATSNSYYFDRRGDTPGGPRPSSPTHHWLVSRLFRLSAYTFEAR